MIEVLNVKRKEDKAVEATLSVDCRIFTFRLINGKPVAVFKESGEVPHGELKDAYARAGAILKPRK